MLNKLKIQEVILQALQNINNERKDGDRFEVSISTPLFGVDGVLDSLSLVSAIVDIEVAISDASGINISLTDDRAMSQDIPPIKNVQTLTEYILLLLSEVDSIK